MTRLPPCAHVDAMRRDAEDARAMTRAFRVSGGRPQPPPLRELDDPYADNPAVPMLHVCAWCQRDGLVIDAPGHTISHGICERHKAELEATWTMLRALEYWPRRAREQARLAGEREMKQ